MTVVDAHQHFWTRELIARLISAPAWKDLIRTFGPQDLKPLLDQVGVQQTVLVQTHSALENSYEFLRHAEEQEWIAAVVGWVDLADPHVDDVLNDLSQHPKFKGVRHQWENETDPAWILRADVLRGLHSLASHGLRYDLLVNPRNWEYLPRIAEAVPDLPMVIDHIGKPCIRDGQFAEWVDSMAEVAKSPQVMCKLSGMVTEADWKNWTSEQIKPYIEEALELFGADRVMFGSDWPVCLLAASYEDVFRVVECSVSGLSQIDQESVFGENARRFYGIAS